MAYLSAYEFYWQNKIDEPHLIGVLPERRQDPERITSESIINWVKIFLGEEIDPHKIFFVEVKIEKNTGEILK